MRTTTKAIPTAAPQNAGPDHDGLDHDGLDHDGLDHDGLDHDGLDHDGLKLAALAHLERWAAPPRHLARVLMRRVDRALAGHPARAERRAVCAAIVARVVEELVRDGIASESEFARARSSRLRHAGNSSAQIRAKLAAKGVSRDEIERTLEAAHDEAPDTDLEWLAACRYARRRGLGPFSSSEATRADRRARDLAAMGRAGFPFELAARVLEAESTDELGEALRAADEA